MLSWSSPAFSPSFLNIIILVMFIHRIISKHFTRKTNWQMFISIAVLVEWLCLNWAMEIGTGGSILHISCRNHREGEISRRDGALPTQRHADWGLSRVPTDHHAGMLGRGPRDQAGLQGHRHQAEASPQGHVRWRSFCSDTQWYGTLWSDSLPCGMRC